MSTAPTPTSEQTPPLKHEMLRVNEAAKHLRATHLFGDLDPSDLIGLAARCTHVRLKTGEILLRQGEPGEHFYIVIEGRLQVVQEGEGGQELLLGEVRRGEHLGEIALLENAPRMATARALTECRLLALSRKDLEQFLEHQPQLREGLYAEIQYRVRWAATRRLRPAPHVVIAALSEFLGGLSAEALATLEGEVEWVTLPRGALLIRQGETGDCLYFLVSGRLRVFGVREDGSEVEINEVGPGESIGEMALLAHEPRSASVAARRDCELLRLSKAGFDRLVAEHPRTMALFARLVVERLNRRIRAREAIIQLRAAPLVSPEECEEVANTQNLVLRNLKITQMYYRLSMELTLLLGHQDANWCTFACNASKTAGYSIRREELPFYELLLMLRRNQRLWRYVERLRAGLDDLGLMQRVNDILDAVSDSISAGNLKVFAELAPIFSRMIRTFHKDVEYDRGKLEAFLSTLKTGPTEAGGQDTLREALTHYYEAMFEPNPKRKAELILLGNIKVGLHEQIRLQPNIVEALNAPLRVGMGLLGKDLLRRIGWSLPRSLAERLRAEADRVEKQLMERLTAIWRRLVTRSLMTLRLPYGEVRLGEDVPRLPNERMYPDMLQELQEPELVRLVRQYDYADQSLRGSRAADWGNLADRMNFIVNLFRSRQKSLELFDQPFLLEQRLEMEANRVPLGPL